MTVPSRDEAARVMLGVGPHIWFVRHVSAVAEVAAFLAAHAERRGVRLDRGLVEAAALLHDVDKALPKTERPAGAHGESGAHWLAARGYPELAEPVACHPVSQLSDDVRYARLLAAAPETRLVAYADKRAAQRLEPMDRRFARWEQKHPELRESLARARERALGLEREVCALAGVRPDEVRRLPWVAAALRRARDLSAAA